MNEFQIYFESRLERLLVDWSQGPSKGEVRQFLAFWSNSAGGYRWSEETGLLGMLGLRCLLTAFIKKETGFVAVIVKRAV